MSDLANAVAVVTGATGTRERRLARGTPPQPGRVLTGDDVAPAVLATITMSNRAMVSELDIRPTNP